MPASIPSVPPAKPWDLAVAYRIYPGIGRPPPCYGDDKLMLSDFCLRSFKQAMEGVKAKIWVLLDGCPPTYRRLFERMFPEGNLVIQELPGVGNLPTFGRQIELLTEQADADWVYFAEDDYFYFPGAFAEMLRQLQRQDGPDFVTPYDHLDYYTSPIHEAYSKPRPAKDRVWRPAGSSCLTFMTGRETLRQTAPLFRSYCRGNTDLALWLSVTRHPTLFPPGALRVARRQPGLLRFLAQSWWFHPGQNARGKRWTLAAPVPTMAAHMERHYLPPGLAWDQIFSEAASAWSMPPIPAGKACA